jgi:hypothetical protein
MLFVNNKFASQTTKLFSSDITPGDALPSIPLRVSFAPQSLPETGL